MIPNFRFECNDQAFGNQLKDRLLEVQFIDRPGISSDSLEIHIDNRDGKARTLKHGEKIQFFLGYKGDAEYKRGGYILDSTSFQGPPDKIVITANAMNFRDAMAGHRNRLFQDVSIADIVRTIASEHNYETFIDPKFETVVIDHLNQINESDLYFLRSLADEYGAISKCLGQSMAFIPLVNKAESIKAALGSTTIHKQECTRYKVGRTDRSRYSGVKALWNDTRTPSGKTEAITVGGGNKLFSLPQIYRTPEQAQAAAEAKWQRLVRSEAEVSITLPGKPSLTCEGQLFLKGFGVADGEYVVTEVTHSLTKAAGFVSQLKASLANN